MGSKWGGGRSNPFPLPDQAPREKRRPPSHPSISFSALTKERLIHTEQARVSELVVVRHILGTNQQKITTHRFPT